MITKMLVKSDGYNLIGRIKTKKPINRPVRGVRSWKSKKFDEYYYEAQGNKIDKKDLPNYIQQRFWEDANDICEDTIDDKEFEVLYDNFQNRLHKRIVKCREKILLNQWSFWVTFTYEDEKETVENFEKRLITCFNNFAKRNGWFVAGAWENGELGDRLHFHAFIYIPEGQMVGELYSASRYSYKRRRMEYYIDNTYFKERFGMSDWIAISNESLADGRLIDYLVKYITKTGRRLFYSRGIPNEFEMEIDTDTDVLMSYNNFGIKYLLNKVKNGMEGLQAMFSSLDYSDCFELDASFCGFCNDEYKVVTIYS